MDWRDEGILLSMRPHGETSAIIEVLTSLHGRHMGVVRGGASRKMAATLQPGTGLTLEWRARLDDHIGAFTVEPVKSRALHEALPEREPHPALWRRTLALMDRLGQEGWLAGYVRWELCLLEEIGFGLDLSTCAVTGATEGLAYVSPKTGRAVTAKAAGDWADRELRAVLQDRPLPEARSRLVDLISRPARNDG